MKNVFSMFLPNPKERIMIAKYDFYIPVVKLQKKWRTPIIRSPTHGTARRAPSVVLIKALCFFHKTNLEFVLGLFT